MTSNTTSHLGTALITGASSGIGAVYADRLARRGYDLILVARDRARLAELANRLSTATGRTIEVLDADLADAAGRARVEAKLREDASITLLVNNAGLGTHTKLLESDVDQMSRMIELNVTALTRLTYAVMPGFVARGRGAVINISSIVAIAPEILNGVYGGTKAFVTAFSQSLHHELASQGVRVQAVLPRRHRDRLLEQGRPAGRAPAQGDRDVGRGHGGCGPGGLRPWRAGHHPAAAGRVRLAAPGGCPPGPGSPAGRQQPGHPLHGRRALSKPLNGALAAHPTPVA